ncbi:SpoIIIAG [Fictibacillus macauensis ZFHKF-1]|uniref:SpoIIIAG n=1 Tax=Fictibacillus macauensis ZFHKF-1 TaxID=1196324 RepID=I8J691_9BACL|nr:stage III sporulation protein AG [Fictibacillus macauensis]EIT87331.1 SpoIIIAG [Fictibacillus macauensis ZFHKF-1]
MKQIREMLGALNDRLGKKTGKKGPPPYIWFLLLVGFGLMIAGRLFSPSSTQPQSTPASTFSTSKETAPVIKNFSASSSKSFTEYETEYGSQLKSILEQVAGVQKVQVMVTLDTTEIKQIEKNENRQNQTTKETDKNGGERTINELKTSREIVRIKTSDQESPIVITTEKPKVRGVIVAAEGADNLKVKEMIVDAVTKVFNIGSDHVSVIPKKYEGE